MTWHQMVAQLKNKSRGGRQFVWLLSSPAVYQLIPAACKTTRCKMDTAKEGAGEDPELCLSVVFNWLVLWGALSMCVPFLIYKCIPFYLISSFLSSLNKTSKYPSMEDSFAGQSMCVNYVKEPGFLTSWHPELKNWSILIEMAKASEHHKWSQH